MCLCVLVDYFLLKWLEEILFYGFDFRYDLIIRVCLNAASEHPFSTTLPTYSIDLIFDVRIVYGYRPQT